MGQTMDRHKGDNLQEHENYTEFDSPQEHGNRPEPDNLVELEDVYMYKEETPVLNGVTTGFPGGSTSVIVGASGCGKSTLLKTSAFLYPPDSGHVFYKKRDIGKMGEKELLAMRAASGFMFQDGALWANKNLWDNLALPVELHRPELSTQEVGNLIRSLVKTFTFTGNLQNRPAAFSAGKQKIISFMRAVILGPSLLFLDEPTTFIDRRSSSIIINQLKLYHQQACTIVMVSHDPEIIGLIGDYLYVMKEGRLLASGLLDDVLNHPDPEVQAEVEEISRLSRPYRQKNENIALKP